MKNKEFYKLLNINKSNSGFTLTELLVGLVMSIFVIGALGFGLMTVLATSQSENSKVKARTENSRALDFISDEVRRARTIDTDLSEVRVTTSTTDKTAFNVTSTNIDSSTGAFNSNTTTNKKIVFALDIPEVSSSATLGADTNASTTERIIYFLKSASGTNWKGPAVLYRWGPPLSANGDYTDGDWAEQALIDGIDNTHITATLPCGSSGGTLTPPKLTGTAPTLTGSALSSAATGFYACINGTNTAQLFLTGQTKTTSGVNDSQTNDSQVVARARETLVNQTNIFNSINWSVEGLGGDYKCKDVASGASVTPVMWHMRTDFSNSATPNTDPNKVSWTQNPTSTTQAQPQPIEIKSNQPLTITSNPTNATECNSSSVPVPHRINFGKPKTFNGVCDPALETGSTCPSDPNPEQVTDDLSGQSKETVQFFKRGSQFQNYGTNALNQQTLGKFLYDKGWAIPVDGGNPNDRATTFKIPTSVTEINNYVDSLTSLTAAEKTAEKARLKVLGEDQRIIGFEVGVHADSSQPGFDLQDNIFIVTSDVFKQKFAPSCFSGTTCSPATGKPPVT